MSQSKSVVTDEGDKGGRAHYLGCYRARESVISLDGKKRGFISFIQEKGGLLGIQKEGKMSLISLGMEGKRGGDFHWSFDGRKRIA